MSGKDNQVQRILFMTLGVLIVLILGLSLVSSLGGILFFECTKYEKIPYRYSGSFFNQQVETIEGNHDGYWNKCIEGTKFDLWLFGGGK